MSRIGKQIIPLPQGVTVTVDGHRLTVKGPKGTLTQSFHDRVGFEQHDSSMNVTVRNPSDRRERALWGLSRVLVSNMVTGVTEGFEKKLEVEGVGFRVQLKGKDLVLSLGFSHPVAFPIPEGVVAAVDANTVTLTGIDKQLVGETAAQLRALKKPEPYKGKGIHYVGEHIRRKAGKVVKGSEGG